MKKIRSHYFPDIWSGVVIVFSWWHNMSTKLLNCFTIVQIKYALISVDGYWNKNKGKGKCLIVLSIGYELDSVEEGIFFFKALSWRNSWVCLWKFFWNILCRRYNTKVLKAIQKTMLPCRYNNNPNLQNQHISYGCWTL